ncbi:hypothetical protein [Azospirillum sp. Marseille-Q6669]
MRDRLSFIRAIGLGRATMTSGIANLAMTFRRLIWLGGELRPYSATPSAYFRLSSQN